MKCPKCDIETVWLFKPINHTHFTHRDEDFSQTDYLMCPICERVWKQWIETKVHRDEVKPEIIVVSKQREVE